MYSVFKSAPTAVNYDNCMRKDCYNDSLDM